MKGRHLLDVVSLVSLQNKIDFDPTEKKVTSNGAYAGFAGFDAYFEAVVMTTFFG